jgi:ATP-dependent helicase HrpB
VERLPIDTILPEILERFEAAGAVVLEAPPGAGKTTRVPVALLGSPRTAGGEVLVSEPRRLAARLVARHVADERGERVGQTVGYSVRFEDVSSAATRVRYVTEGVLIRRLMQDPLLRGVSAVVLDELHERSLSTDLALALLRRLRAEQRPELGLVVMSATLDAEPVARFLGDCPRVRSEGRLFPLTFSHLDRPDDRPLEKQVASAVREALGASADGDVLVFLPGAGEIRRTKDALAPLAEREGFDLLPLHGDLPIEEQARAVERGRRRKVVLSTNVAETSVTIDGVTTVVDSGLARVARHSPWSGLPRLEVVKVSRASATQRAGRAGRTRAGHVIRLYTRGDFEARPEHDAPEIRRLDLAEALLTRHGAGIERLDALDWLEPPPEAAAKAAETLLASLGAIDDAGALTDVGRRMLAFPLHPRLARLVVEGEILGIAERAALAAALLSERDIRKASRTSFGEGRRLDAARGDSDVSELVDRFDEASDARFDARRLGHMGLDSRSVRAVERARNQVARLARDRGEEPETLDEGERRLRRALLTAFPDRVARRARAGSDELTLSGGGSAKLSENSVVHDATFLIAVDVEERTTGRRGGASVRLASAIDPDWLLDLYLERIAENEELSFNPRAERVELLRRMSYGSVVLDESRAPAPPSPEASRLLARVVLDTSASLESAADLDSLLCRIELARSAMPEAGLPDLGSNAREQAIERACAGLVSLDEVRGLSLADAVLQSLTPEQQRLLREEVPRRITLAGGRGLSVCYEPGKPPWIESRLQDFFGSVNVPSICKGRVPITLHLLAPNRRAVQVTTDLAGFWERHYPSIRRELMRRYPKHAWPEDGRTATPPQPRRR